MKEAGLIIWIAIVSGFFISFILGFFLSYYLNRQNTNTTSTLLNYRYKIDSADRELERLEIQGKDILNKDDDNISKTEIVPWLTAVRTTVQRELSDSSPINEEFQKLRNKLENADTITNQREVVITSVNEIGRSRGLIHLQKNINELEELTQQTQLLVNDHNLKSPWTYIQVFILVATVAFASAGVIKIQNQQIDFSDKVRNANQDIDNSVELFKKERKAEADMAITTFKTDLSKNLDLLKESSKLTSDQEIKTYTISEKKRISNSIDIYIKEIKNEIKPNIEEEVGKEIQNLGNLEERSNSMKSDIDILYDRYNKYGDKIELFFKGIKDINDSINSFNSDLDKIYSEEFSNRVKKVENLFTEYKTHYRNMLIISIGAVIISACSLYFSRFSPRQ